MPTTTPPCEASVVAVAEGPEQEKERNARSSNRVDVRQKRYENRTAILGIRQPNILLLCAVMYLMFREKCVSAAVERQGFECPSPCVPVLQLAISDRSADKGAG